MHIAQKVDIFDFENDCYMQIDIHINRDNRYCVKQVVLKLGYFLFHY